MCLCSCSVYRQCTHRLRLEWAVHAYPLAVHAYPLAVAETVVNDAGFRGTSFGPKGMSGESIGP